MKPTTDRVYKILRANEAEVLQNFGRFTGSDADDEDGFIHLAFGHQIESTLAEHFADVPTVLVTLDAPTLGEALRFEISRDGAYFPHLYGAIVDGAVLATHVMAESEGDPNVVPELQPDVVRFYNARDPFGEFSNFFRAPISLDGVWPTSEHYFQAMKFEDSAHRERIQRAPSPKLAKQLGQSRDVPLRADWEKAKDGVMRAALEAKFGQHAALAAMLVGTGSATLVEHSADDAVWADGGDGSGENRLGHALEAVRETLA